MFLMRLRAWHLASEALVINCATEEPGADQNDQSFGEGRNAFAVTCVNGALYGRESSLAALALDIRRKKDGL